MVGRRPLGDKALHASITIPVTRAMLDRLSMEAEKRGEGRTVFARQLLTIGLGMKEPEHG